MVPKKSKSKRVSCSQRYKVQKKVNEHHRKQRREAKRNPLSAKTKLKKDPGVPNLFPLKEKLLNSAMEEKQKAELEKKQRKMEQSSMMVSDDSTPTSIEEFAALAKKRGELFEDSTSIHSSKNLQRLFLNQSKSSKSSNLYARTNDDSIMEEDEEDEEEAPEGVAIDSEEYTEILEGVTSGRKDNSKKAYYKEFKNVVEKADVILEVLDVRDPLGCRARDIEELIHNAGSQKKIILLLNKVDLVPREVVSNWMKYLKNEYPTIAFKASTQNQRHNLGQKSGDILKMKDKDLSGSESVGADDLIQLLKNYCRSEGMKTTITVGVIGYPNVGKSSVINSLKRSKVCQVGSTPGVTKTSQIIQLDKNVKLLDSPGIVFSNGSNQKESDRAEILLRNCVKVELVEDPITPIAAILRKTTKEKIMKLYNIRTFVDSNDMLVQIARASGRLRRVSFNILFYCIFINEFFE